MSRRFKAVFFDLDGTLRINYPSPTEAFILFLRQKGFEIDDKTSQQVKIWAHYYWGNDTLVNRDKERFTPERFWLNYSELLLKQAGILSDNGLAYEVRDWFENFYEPTVKLPENGWEVLQALQADGYHLGLISNRPEPLADVVLELGLDGIFEFTLAAGEIGHWKPDPTIFQVALSRYQDLPPEACVYVGDNLYADGHGAARAGLVPVIFDPDGLFDECPYWCIRHMNELLDFLSQ
ncbi:MAG: HAD family hydrolase [Chloroflexi bacterium]|nr:MAG: HAD family hydrolase [Chloroflexota bacterium]